MLTKEPLLAIMDKDHIPGMSFAALINGKLSQTFALGIIEARVEDPVNVTPETFFEGASLSKPFFAYLVLRLVQEGQFDLKTPLHKILPFNEFLQEESFELIGEDHSEALTAELVFSHRTGLPGSGWQAHLHQPLVFRFKPGDEYEYSGFAYGYLQKVIEKKTGLTLEELAQKEFVRLGMKHSTFRRPGYVLCLMPDFPHNIPQQASVGKIYVSDDGNYYVRDPKGVVQKGSFQELLEAAPGNIGTKLRDKEFKDQLLLLTSKRNHTLSSEQCLVAIRHDEKGNSDPLSDDRISKQNPHAAFTLHTTATDYALFIQELMSNKALHYAFSPAILMDKDAFAREQNVPLADLEKVSWCLGWARQGDVMIHWGDCGPTKALAVFNPTTGMGMVYFANSMNAFISAEEIVSLVFKDTDLKPFFNFLCGKYNYERNNKPDWSPTHFDAHQFEMSQYEELVKEKSNQTLKL